MAECATLSRRGRCSLAAINETFYVDDNIEAMTSQLNVMSILTIESSISEQKLLQAVAKSSKSDPFVKKLYSQQEKTILTHMGSIFS